jgi:hypothetical protein
MHTRNRQRGQAMSELIAAMALFIPLVLGVIYVGKYSDIKHQAIQASRYAAMERALDPQKAQEQDQVIAAETVARFFRDGGQHDIGFEDQAQDATAGDENPNWAQAGNGGAPLLAQYSDVSVQLSTQDIAGSTLKTLEIPAGKQFNELGTGNFGFQADVEVPIANIPDHGPLTALMQALNLRVGATTVMGGDAWGGAGIEDVANHFTQFSVAGRDPGLEATFDNVATQTTFKVFTDAGAPVFGCVKPDIVPPNAAPGAKYDSNDDPLHPSNANDQCYE